MGGAFVWGPIQLAHGRKRWIALGVFLVAVAWAAVGWSISNPASVALKRAASSDDELPAARMDHWAHQADFQCYSCHPVLFQMGRKAGAITHEAMAAGKYCGGCHDGVVAFISDKENGDLDCEGCHAD